MERPYSVSFWRKDYGYRTKSYEAIGPFEAVQRGARDYCPNATLLPLKKEDSETSPIGTTLKQWSFTLLHLVDGHATRGLVMELEDHRALPVAEGGRK